MSSEEPLSARYRVFSGPGRFLQAAVLGALPVLGVLYVLRVPVYFGVVLFTEQVVGIFLSLFLLGTFLSVPAGRSGQRGTLPWYDAVLALLSLPAGLWLAVFYPRIVAQLGQLDTGAVIAGGLAVLLILEAVRRLVGLVLVITCAVFLLYGAYSVHLPGLLAGAPLTWERLLMYVYLDPNSLLSMLGLAATIGVAFVVFGQILIHFGGGDSITNIALLMFGRVRGGPAKAAIVGSSLVGTVTGAPMSNVFLTGTITIPLMIRVGYPRLLAAAVEAVASAGGQLMPPVMGIAAFLIAERLGVPYSQVALAALLPALLYYLGVFIQVDLEAAKRGLRGLRGEELPEVRSTVVGAWPVLVVLAALVYMIFFLGMEPGRAALFGGFLAFVLQELRRRQGRTLPARVFAALEGSGRLLLEVAAALAAAGIVVGVISVSGLGFTLGFVMTQLGRDSLFLLLLLGAAGAVVLGMGMPTVAAYALVAVLVGPALSGFGIDPMAAQLFIFYFAIVSNFTPPVAVTAFAAAALARTSPMRAALVGVRLGVLAYLVPFLFVYSPTLLLKGNPLAVLVSGVTAVVGTLALGAGLGGYLATRLAWWQRVVLAVAGVALLVPIQRLGVPALVNAAGFVAALLVMIPAVLAARAAGPAPAPGAARAPVGEERG